MIDLCFATEENKGQRPLDRRALIRRLEEQGVAFRRVGQPTPNSTCLLFAAVESDAVTQLAAHVRDHVVLVAEGEAPTPAEAESTRKALGLLGLVEPRAWRNWQRGLFVGWGLFARADIAEAAGLALANTQGLQPTEGHAELSTSLARLLLAAERSIS